MTLDLWLGNLWSELGSIFKLQPPLNNFTRNWKGLNYFINVKFISLLFHQFFPILIYSKKGVLELAVVTYLYYLLLHFYDMESSFHVYTDQWLLWKLFQ